MNKSILLLGLMLVCFCSVRAQIRYGISMNAGISNLLELNQTYMYDEDGYRIPDLFEYNSPNYFTYNKAFEVSGFVIEPVKQTKYSFEQGITIESVSYNFNTPEIIFPNDTIHANKWEERFWSIGIPLKVRYDFEKWMTLYVGVNNVFHVYENNDILYSPPMKYTLRGECGVDFTLLRKFILGAKYSHDITPFTKLNNYDVSYRFEIISLKLGYLF